MGYSADLKNQCYDIKQYDISGTHCTLYSRLCVCTFMYISLIYKLSTAFVTYTYRFNHHCQLWKGQMLFDRKGNEVAYLHEEYLSLNKDFDVVSYKVLPLFNTHHVNYYISCKVCCVEAMYHNYVKKSVNPKTDL